MKYIIFLISIFLLVSCGTVPLPTEKMTLDKLNAKIFPKEQPLYEYSNLKKLNGVEGEISGIKIYQLDYSIDKVAKQDLKAIKNILGKLEFKADSAAIADSISWSKYVNRWGGQQVHFDKSIKKGEIIETIKGSMKFVKKENGWE